MKTILVIEDEKVIRETIYEILELSNYHVLVASDGAIGLEIAQKEYPDLVLCDIMMPKMNGLETLEAFKNNSVLRCIPFIFLSAMSEVKDIRAGMLQGAEDYLTKPFKTQELLKVIEVQLNKIGQKIKSEKDKYQMELILNNLKEKAANNEQKWEDYLNSAQRIQNVILPTCEELNSIFPDNYLYFQPKYKVSGDFYWCKDFGDHKMVAVADCTGHGISASLLTICCYNGLNLAVEQYGLKSPREILEKVNELVLNFMLEHSKTHHGVGMDIALCVIDENNKKVTLSGAKRPVYLISDKTNLPKGSYKTYRQKVGKPLFKIKGSLYSIGGKLNSVSLDELEFNYQEGDQIILSSDGYGDQFGGPVDKTFKSCNLIRLLLSIQHESMCMQQKILAKTFKEWKGCTEQIDDVCILGLKL